MSWLSKGAKKLTKGAKKLVTDPGAWAKNVGKEAVKAAPYAAAASFLVPGVGPMLGSGLTAAASKAANLVGKIPGGTKALEIGGAIGSKVGGAAQQGFNALHQGAGGEGSKWGTAAKLGIAGLGAFESHKASRDQAAQQRAARAIADEQLSRSRELFDGARPIRQAGEAGMMDMLSAGPQSAPDLSQIRNTNNPFAKPAIAPPPAAAPMATAAPAAPPVAPGIPMPDPEQLRKLLAAQGGAQ